MWREPRTQVEPFRGTRRFVLERRLGEGGMGVVYRARDLERGGAVALKTLTRVEPAAIFRFKSEFRALADLAHPNVVQLFELVNDGRHWFFTMELVDGVTFTRYVLGDPALLSAPSDGPSRLLEPPPDGPESDAATTGVVTPRAAPPYPSRAPRSGPRAKLAPDVARLRAALGQLAEGVAVLHAAGKLHRDLKPSNVLVTPEGRVVVLDFGLARDVHAAAGPPEDPILGTPAYMAPEQASSRAASPASDWYAVGSMLYECLTGRLPFQGSPLEMLYEKQQGTPPRPSWVADGPVPPDLEALCMALLSPRPDDRPDGDEVRRRLGEGAPPRSTPAAGWHARAPFLGRRGELASLGRALAEVGPGRPRVVLVRGESGVGKTALVKAFVERVRATEEAAALAGRCYEREDVPYKAFDDVIDGLARLLRADGGDGALGELPPPRLAELSLLFPVLATVPALRHLPPPDDDDPREARRRAAGALKALLGELGRARPVVLFIDDLHWGDADSARLLLGLLSPPDAPALLVVGTCRADGAGAGGPVVEALGRAPLGPPTVLELAELPEPDATELAAALGGPRLRGSARAAAAIAREAQGHPLFIAELVRHVEATTPGDGADGADGVAAGVAGPASLEAALAGRVATLPDEARRLLEAVALAGRPVELPVALRAAGLEPSDLSAARTLLVARLVRTKRAAGRDLVECAHDRVRGAADGGLRGAARRGAHGRLADALAKSGRADPEDLWEHYLGAGDAARARHFAARAAEAAGHALAFLRAARLYRVALGLGPDEPGGRLRRALAAALVNGGRGAEAARVYVELAAEAPPAEAFELRRLAAEHFLKAGLEDEGLALLRPLLREAGLSYPEGPRAALAALLVARARLRVTALQVPARAAEVPARELARADVAYAAAAGLALTDVPRGTGFGVRALLLALRTGEPVRVCRALALVAMSTAYEGPRAERRALGLARAARELGERAGDARAVALAELAAASIPLLLGDWSDARARLARAERLLSARCRGAHWELASARAWLCNVLIFLGRLGEARRLALELSHEAAERGDRFARVHVIYPACVAHLVDDEPDAARRAADELSTAAAPGRFANAHWGALVAGVSIDRYVGDGGAAWRRVRGAWRALRRSLLLRVQMVRVFAHFERALCALAAADAGAPAEPLVRAAEADARRLAREGVPYARAMGRYALAGALAAQGRRAEAIAALRDAVDGCAAAGLGYFVACARERYGALRGGGEGDEASARARAFFAAEGVRSPARCLAMSAPGFRRLLGGAPGPGP